MTNQEAAEVVKFILAGFPAQRQKMSDDDVRGMVAFYAAGLADLDADVARKAVTRVGATAKFIPTVAEIREAVGVVHHGEQPPAVIAWGEVHKFMGSKGAYRTPGVDFVFADPLTAEVVRAIGWEAMCTGLPDHIRSRFLDGYALLAKDARKIAAVSAGGRNPELGAPRTRERIEQPRTLEQLLAQVDIDDKDPK